MPRCGVSHVAEMNQLFLTLIAVGAIGLIIVGGMQAAVGGSPGYLLSGITTLTLCIGFDGVIVALNKLRRAQEGQPPTAGQWVRRVRRWVGEGPPGE